MKKRGFTLIELMIVVAIIGILAAIAIPDFLRFQAKSRQSEARVNLAGIVTCQVSYFGETNHWGTRFTGNYSIGWSPVGKTKYAFTMGTDAESQLTDIDGSCTGVVGQCLGQVCSGAPGPDATYGAVCQAPDCSGFTALAIGNVDADTQATDLDCWFIDLGKTPTNPYDDVNM